jgi:hypothetical protein
MLIAVGVGVGAFVVALTLTVLLSWRFWLPFAVAGATGGAAFALSAVLLTLDHRRLLWAAERALHVDLDRDDVVGEPEPAEVLRVELTQRDNGRTRMAFIDLPASRSQLRTLARGLLNGKGTGESEWIGSKGPFSRSEFGAVRAALIGRGLAVWSNPNHHAQGWELTAAGRAVMRRIAKTEPTALPRGANGRTRSTRGVRVRA